MKQFTNNTDSDPCEPSLPLEMMSYISSFLIEPQSRMNFSLASKAFKAIEKTSSSIFWREMTIKYFSYLLRNPELLKKYTNDNGRVQYEEMFKAEYARYEGDPLAIITEFYTKFQKELLVKAMQVGQNQSEATVTPSTLMEDIKCALTGNVDKITSYSNLKNIYHSQFIFTNPNVEQLLRNLVVDKIHNVSNSSNLYRAFYGLALSNGHMEVLNKITDEQEKSNILSIAICYTCSHGDYQGIQDLMEVFPDLSRPILCDPNQLTNFIFIAVNSHSLSLVKYLFSKYLQIAAPHQNLEWIKDLISDLNTRKLWDMVAVMAEQIRFYLLSHSEQNFPLLRETLCHIWDAAADSSHLPLVVQYFTEIADVNHKKSKLLLLASTGNTDIVVYLFDQLQTNLTVEEQHQILLSTITSKNSLATFLSLWDKMHFSNALTPDVVKAAYSKASKVGRSDIVNDIDSKTDCLSRFDRVSGALDYFTYGAWQNPSDVIKSSFSRLTAYFDLSRAHLPAKQKLEAPKLKQTEEQQARSNNNRF